MRNEISAEPVMTAAHIAVAIVAACGVTGTKPERAFDNGDGQGRTRVMAAAGCMARLGWSKADAARLFRVHPNRLTPSGQGLARIETTHLLIIAEALAAHGLCQPDNARARFLRPYGPGADAKEAVTKNSPEAAAAAAPQRKAGSGEAAVAADVRAQEDAGPEGVAGHEGPPVFSVRKRVRRDRFGLIRPTASAARPDALKTERLRPVTDRVIRWTRQQLALGADVDFVAWCFDVDAEVLAQRVRPVQAVAA